MELPSNFYKSEYRQGFFVSEEMKRYWASNLNVLEVIDRVCKKHNIKYFLFYGTLLGAVRHQGFIPWDDDMDIAMLRKDYEKFEQVIESELPEGYYYNSHNSSQGSSQPFGCVNCGKLPSIDPEWLASRHGCPYISGIDVFPLDKLPADEELVEMQKTLIQVLFNPIRLVPEFEDYEEQYEKSIAAIEEFLNTKIDRSGDVTNQILKLIERVSKLYNDADDASDNYAVYCYFAYRDKRYKAEWLENTTLLQIENTSWPAPVGYDEVLKAGYGDYMKPVKFTADHGYPVYKEQKKGIAQQLQSAKTAAVTEFLCNTFEKNLSVKLVKDYPEKGFYLDADNKAWVARIPNESFVKYADYEIEKSVYNQLANLEVTDKLQGIITENGLKITHNIPDYRFFDPENSEDMYFAMCALNAIHNSGIKVSRKLDLAERINAYEQLWGNTSYNVNYQEVKEQVMKKLAENSIADNELKISHFNSTMENILLFENENGANIVLREFEQTVMADELVDIAILAIDAGYSQDKLHQLLEMYYEEVTEGIVKRAFAYCAAIALLKNNMWEYYNRRGKDFDEKEQNYFKQAEYYLNI